MFVDVIPAQQALAAESLNVDHAEDLTQGPAQDAENTTHIPCAVAAEFPLAAGEPVVAPAVGDLDGVVVVQVVGDIDLYTGPRLRQVLTELLPRPGAGRPPVRADGAGAASAERSTLPGTPEPAESRTQVPAEEPAKDPEQVPEQVRAVVVDLRRVEFMDSFALGVLVHGHRLSRTGGRAYALVSTSTMVTKLFEMTGLAKVMPLHPDLPTALAGLHPAGLATTG